MANESGTSAVTGWINTSVIQQLVHWYLFDNLPVQKMVYAQPIRGQGTATAAFNRVTKQTALSGTITELTGLANTAFQTAKVTATIAEVGILRQFTKLVEQTNLYGPEGLHMQALQDGVNMCLEKYETDCMGQAANASTTVGTSGAAFTVANFAAGISQLTINKAVGPYVAILTSTQVKNLRAEVAASGAGVFAAGLGNEVMKPVGTDGYVGNFFGVPAYTNNLGTVSGANTLGMFMTDGNRNPAYAPFGAALGWMPEPASLINPVFSGGLQLAVTMAYGHIEIQDGAYVGIPTIT